MPEENIETPDPDDILEPTMREAKRILDEMSETKDLAQRKAQSEILKNLCESAGVFFELLKDTMITDDFPFMDDPIPFDEED